MKILRILVFLFPIVLFSQENQNNYWYFGDGVGIDFSSGTPVNTSGNLFTEEGCASISDDEGNLLFYTDGITIYNSNHTVMPNGTGLLGHPSATSSGLIVPQPCSALFYVFTVDEINGESGLNYSLVDMSLDNGLGDVIQKNVMMLLQDDATEKLCALKQSNGEDFFVVTCTKNTTTDNFYVYEVTSEGLKFVNKQSVGGKINSWGYLKASGCGDKIALANYGNDSLSIEDVTVFDFDNVTGTISNPLGGFFDYFSAYGIEFSPNCAFLYYSVIGDFGSPQAEGQVYQVDLSLDSFSPTLIGTIPNINESDNQDYACGALQISPEASQRIFLSKPGEFELAVIERPNLPHPDCMFNENAFSLNKLCKLGLPTFISGKIAICGACNPLEYEDKCGVCDANPTNDDACLDCAGTLGGIATEDECGVCDEDPTNDGVSCLVLIPTAFSPNGDGINDQLTISNQEGNIEVASFNIYNRWGNLVYSKTNFTVVGNIALWDGILKTKTAPIGVYLYDCVLSTGENKTKLIKGTVTLIQ